MSRNIRARTKPGAAPLAPGACQGRNTSVTPARHGNQSVNRNKWQASWAYRLCRAIVSRLSLGQLLQQGVLHDSIVRGAQSHRPHHLRNSLHINQVRSGSRPKEKQDATIRRSPVGWTSPRW